MAYRVTTYQQAFEGELGVKINDEIRKFLARMEQDGHTEKSICYSIWRSRDKLLSFRSDGRFFGVLRNEILKYSWPKNDPRWEEYWKRKKEEQFAEQTQKEIHAKIRAEHEQKAIDRSAKAYLRCKSDNSRQGYIYFIQGQCGGAIKIGHSDNPKNRLKELQTGYPDTLKMLLLIPGSEQTEKALHHIFRTARLRGEWFRPDPLVIDKIKELAAKHAKPKQTAEEEPDPNSISHSSPCVK